MLKVFRGSWKKIVLSVMKKHLIRHKESNLKHSIALLSDHFLEQEFENFNRDEVGK